MHRTRNVLQKHLIRGIFIGPLAILLLRAGGAEAAALKPHCGAIVWATIQDICSLTIPS
jgi:hypothetical protein